MNQKDFKLLKGPVVYFIAHRWFFPWSSFSNHKPLQHYNLRNRIFSSVRLQCAFFFMKETPSILLPERISSITVAVCLIIYWSVAVRNPILLCCLWMNTLLPWNYENIYLFIFCGKQTRFFFPLDWSTFALSEFW